VKALLLAIEGGGTKTRILLGDAEGNVLARETGGPASGLYIHRGTYARATAALLHRIRRAAQGFDGRVVAVGMGGPMERNLIQTVVRQVFGRVSFVEAGESEIAFALYGLRWGISLIAGTGASCRALNEDGVWAGCGGFGPQFGDEGSGYWIGRSAIAAAMRAGDGRGMPTVLTERLCAFYGVPRVFDLLTFIDRGGHVSGTKIAAFAPEVFAAAMGGDAVARVICREAGHELGKLVRATAQRVVWRTEPVPLVLTGGVFNGGSLIMEPVRAMFRRSAVRFHVYPVVPEPTEGIFRIMLARSKTVDSKQ
jgi:N-acetylglucosamine kinase-like BadF-type ATPase